MDKLTEKFDKLPLEFDTEALWQKIEKPKKKGKFSGGKAVFVIMVLIVPAISFLILNKKTSAEYANTSITAINSLESYQQQSKDISSASTLKQTKTDTVKFIDHTTGANNRKSTNLIINDSFSFDVTKSYSKGENKNSIIQRNVINPISKADTNEINNQIRDLSIQQETVTKETFDSVITQNKNLIIENKNQKEGLQDLALLPSKSFVLKIKTESLKPTSGLIEPFTKYQKKNRIGLYAGIGKHQSLFTPIESSNANLRDSFEQAQNDIVVGLTYDRKLYKGFFFSFSSEYNLYKEKIITSHLREMQNSWEQVDFKLFNHYHVLSGNVLIGKEIRIKGFFLDLSGGAGLRFYQKADVDYFNEVGVLVQKSEAEAEYASSTSFYFIIRGAIRKQLTENIFFRTGIQYKSKTNLNNSSVEILHQIKPMSLNFEIGYNF